jgi:hypothetical protein
LKQLVKTIVILLLLACSVEVAVRISGRGGSFFTEPAFQTAGRNSYWRYQADGRFTVYGPTVLRTGAYGERTHNQLKLGAGPLVAVFGDSFTFGQAVGDRVTWPARVEENLQKRFPGARVLNFGVQGHSFDMIVAHARDRLRTITPAVVVLAFIGDDLDPGRAQKHVDRFGYLARGPAGVPVHKGIEILRAIARQSHALLLFKHWLDGPPGGIPVRASSPNTRATPAHSKTAGAEGRLASLRWLHAELAEIPLVLAELDLRETENSRLLRDQLPAIAPEAALVYLPPRFAETEPAQWRVAGDGHPSPRAHAVYASTLTPVIADALMRTTMPDSRSDTASDESP